MKMAPELTSTQVRTDLSLAQAERDVVSRAEARVAFDAGNSCQGGAAVGRHARRRAQL